MNKELIILELDVLRENSTPKQKDKLNTENFYPESSTRCIYGQLFGHSHETRAFKVKQKYIDRGGETYNYFSKNRVNSEDINVESHSQYTYLEFLLAYRKITDIDSLINYIKMGDLSYLTFK